MPASRMEVVDRQNQILGKLSLYANTDLCHRWRPDVAVHLTNGLRHTAAEQFAERRNYWVEIGRVENELLLVDASRRSASSDSVSLTRS